jgi:hypothetical protein
MSGYRAFNKGCLAPARVPGGIWDCRLRVCVGVNAQRDIFCTSESDQAAWRSSRIISLRNLGNITVVGLEPLHLTQSSGLLQYDRAVRVDCPACVGH